MYGKVFTNLFKLMEGCLPILIHIGGWMRILSLYEEEGRPLIPHRVDGDRCIRSFTHDGRMIAYSHERLMEGCLPMLSILIKIDGEMLISFD